MAKRLALAAVLGGTLLIAAAYAASLLFETAPAWAAWAMALGTTTVMVASMALGAARNGRIGRLKVPFALCFLVLAGGFALALGLPASSDATFVLGLPLRAAVVLLGIGLVPLLFLPVAYALTFDEMTLSDDDLARIRAAARELQAGAGAVSASIPTHPHATRVAEVEAV